MPPSRAPDRPHIHNPNYQTAPNPPPPAYASPAPLPAGPQPHAPFADAYQRPRDPFLPPTPAQRHEQPYGRANGEHYTNGHGPPAWSSGPAPVAVAGPAADSSSTITTTTAAHHHLPPQPSAHHAHSAHPYPAPSSSHASPLANGTAHMYGYGSAQRASHADGSPQNYHSGPAVDGHHPPPPPPQLPPFGARHMPPPSPPQGQSLPFGAPGPPPPPQFPSGRDLPSIRSGSGMSISSILGGSGSGAARRSPPGGATSPPSKSMRPPSPRAGPYGGARLDYGQWRRPLTPERAAHSGSALGDHRPYSAASPALGGSATSPDYAHPPSSLHRYTSSHPAAPPSDARAASHWRADGGPPPRPNSQPATAQGLPPPPLIHDTSDPSRHRPAYYSAPAAEQRRSDEEQQRVRSISDPRAGERERPSTVQPVAGASYSPPAAQRYPGSHYSPGGYPMYGPDNAPRENGVVPDDRPPYPSYGPPPPPAYGPAPGHQESSPTQNGIVHAAARDYQRSPGPSFRGASEPFPARPPHQLNGLDRRSDVYPGSASEVPARAHPYDLPNARMGEELQHQRLQLNISPETFRRQLGRASPLPQAVQGAQGQMKGPGGDPNIKSEFGRMFSGLGSGYGGTATPSRGSPMPQGRGDGAEFGSGELDSLQMVRSGSRGMKGRRRFKEEDGRGDSEYGDRAGTPSGTKRAKHSHTPANHHHHPHMVHHHHHHKPEDDHGMVQARSATPTAFANRLAASVNQNLGPQAVGAAPHHHHHYPPHHHNHVHGHVPHHHHPAGSVKQQTPIPVAPAHMQRRKTVVNSQAVLESVADKPRSHLGSQLYKVKYELPPRSSSITVLSNVPGPLGISDRFGYTMKPLPIPKFDASRAGCTFTVRVPRLYLSTEKREEICRHRFLWGSDVYSDDSDPIAAAIHAGWIQGAWTREIDSSLLELGGDNNDTGANGTTNGNGNGSKNGVKADSSTAAAATTTTTTEIPATMTAPPPTGPVHPPQETDCHITLLLLPQLTRYSASTRHGIRSRAWAEPHDGLSYQILKVEWVDEGAFGGGAMEERGGAARRRRLEAKAKERARAIVRVMAAGAKRKTGAVVPATGVVKRRGRVNGFGEGRPVVEAVG